MPVNQNGSKLNEKVFRKDRDLDHDGKLNRREVELWLIPIDYDNIQAETLHLQGVKKPLRPPPSRTEEQMISSTILYQIKAREKLYVWV